MWSTPWRWIRLCCWSSSAPWCFSSRSSAVSGRFVTPPACWRRYDWSLISWSLSSDISSVQCYMLQFDWWVRPSSDCSGRLFGSCSFWGSWRPSSSCRSLRESWDISSLTRWHHTDDISRYKITSCSRLTLSVWMMLFLFRWWRGRRSWWWRPSSSTGRTRTWRTPSTSSRRRWRSSRVIRVWDDPLTEDRRARWCWTDGCCVSVSVLWSGELQGLVPQRLLQVFGHQPQSGGLWSSLLLLCATTEPGQNQNYILLFSSIQKETTINISHLSAVCCFLCRRCWTPCVVMGCSSWRSARPVRTSSPSAAWRKSSRGPKTTCCWSPGWPAACCCLR